MSDYHHEMTVHAPLKTVWEFLRQYENWAQAIPGYMDHEIINEKESTWQFKLNFGFIKKIIHLQVVIIQWKESERLTLKFRGINEKISGTGIIKTAKVTPDDTKISAFLYVTAEGSTAKMLRPFLKTNQTGWREELTTIIEEKIADYRNRR